MDGEIVPCLSLFLSLSLLIVSLALHLVLKLYTYTWLFSSFVLLHSAALVEVRRLTVNRLDESLSSPAPFQTAAEHLDSQDTVSVLYLLENGQSQGSWVVK